MKNAIFSRINLNDDNDYSLEFNKCIEDLVDLPDILQLDKFYQHINTSRLQHSINVAYYSFVVCKKLNLDYRSAARAGLLHDLFLYDWRTNKQPEGYHAKAHPIVALKNAKKNTTLNEIEADAIVNHMWPLTPTLPKFKESYIVSFVDKYCACCEISDFYFTKSVSALTIIKWILNGGVFARV